MIEERSCSRRWDVPMCGTSPDFIVRELDTNRGWVIEAPGQDGKFEQLAGVYISAAHARNWIAARSDRSQKVPGASPGSLSSVIPIADPRNNAK
jgi:hypothetical protein